jgi:deoxycytidylate deaminase
MSGPCAKRTVRCLLVTPHGCFSGSNACENPQAVCPRAPGEGYEKCKTVCQQGAHAEIQALELAQAAGASIKGAVAYVSGHHYVCEPCGAALKAAGAMQVVVILNPPEAS